MLIQVSRLNEKSAKVAEFIFSTLHANTIPETFLNWFLGKESPRFSFEIASIHQHIGFFIWTPREYEDLITAQLYAQYPDIDITRVKDYSLTHNIHAKHAVGVELQTSEPYIYPIKRHPQFEDKNAQTFHDPLSAITSALSSFESIEQVWIQTIIQPLDSAWRRRGLWVANKVKGGFCISSPNYGKWYTNMLLKRGWERWMYLLFVRPALFCVGLGPKMSLVQMKEEVETAHDKETAEHSIMGKLSQLGFNSTLRMIYIPALHNVAMAEQRLQQCAASFYQFNIPRFNSFSTVPMRGSSEKVLKSFQEREISHTSILSTEEVATLWHLPNLTVTTPNIQWVESRKIEAPLNIASPETGNAEDLTLLGALNFRKHKKLFGIKPDDRRRHMYIIGKTGMGKSTILENMIVSDIEQGKGVAVIDPHGDLAENILQFIPKSRTNDVIIFNPSDADFPVSFNMLECKSAEQRHLVASGLLGVFKKMFGESWGPRLEHILRNTLLALTESPDATMLGIMKMLTDAEFREKVVNKVTDPMVKSFWIDEFGSWAPKTVAENVSPIQNKVGQFLSSPLIRNIFGQPKSSVDLRFFMDKQKIVIINLSKGRIGEDNSSLLGSMMITKFQIDAMSRADTPEKERVDFYLYVDEFQNFATDSFATILSEARKYRLNLTMANQYVEQMSEEVQAAIFGNVGSMIACQVGAEDAEIFSKQFAERILPVDIINLPKYKCYVRLMIDGVSSNVFSANTLPPPKRKDNIAYADAENIVKVSRERYSKARDFVEGKIGQWMAKGESKNTKK